MQVTDSGPWRWLQIMCILLRIDKGEWSTGGSASIPINLVRTDVEEGGGESLRTQVIQAPLSAPKAMCHAGSRDWKYSSGWKNVRTLSPFSIRNAIRNSRISREVVSSRR